MTPSGIKPATCRFVAYCLNHYATLRPINEVSKMIIEEYVSRLAIQKRGRGLNKPRVKQLTLFNQNKRYLSLNGSSPLCAKNIIMNINDIR